MKIFLCCLIVGCIIFLFYETKKIKTIKIEIKDKKIPLNFDGYKIIFISDLHLGKYLKKRELIKIVNKINSYEADLILFGGDLLGIKIEKYYSKEELTNIFSSFNTTKRYGVLGNHEYKFKKVKSKKEAEEWVNTGFKILSNETMVLKIKDQEITILGIDWENCNFQPKLDESKFNVLLAHHPDSILSYDNIDLALGGHSHGGQIRIPLIDISHKEIFKRGIHKYNQSTIVVNNGLGYSDYIKLRFFAKRHIIKIVLRSERDGK